jgi:FKBP-type peptidyl-prolyl cis-trans isomerase SlyD
VVEVTDDEVTVDGNHPLAGKTLTFNCTVADVRMATPEELAHGHVHEEGGHTH